MEFRTDFIKDPKSHYFLGLPQSEYLTTHLAIFSLIVFNDRLVGPRRIKPGRFQAILGLFSFFRPYFLHFLSTVFAFLVLVCLDNGFHRPCLVLDAFACLCPRCPGLCLCPRCAGHCLYPSCTCFDNFVPDAFASLCPRCVGIVYVLDALALVYVPHVLAIVYVLDALALVYVPHVLAIVFVPNALALSMSKTTDDIQFLLENDSVEVAEMVTEYANDLSGTLGYMEEQLELLLDTIMFKCRMMLHSGDSIIILKLLRKPKVFLVVKRPSFLNAFKSL
ncbi:hypothetical protein HKD37_16G044907 [Glycine soja]